MDTGPALAASLSIQPVQASLFAFKLRSSTSMGEKVALDKAWAEAARRCRLSPADVRMAKELGFKPRSLLRRPAIAAAALEGARRGVGPRPVCQTPTPQRAAAPATRTY